MNLLPNVFIEATHAASIIPFASEATLYAMQSFGGHNMTTAAAFAFVGAIIGQSFNWGLGKLLMRLPAAPKEHKAFTKGQYLFNRYGFFLLFFAYVPLVNLLVVVAGMFATPLKKALPIIALGLAFNYGQLVF